MNDNSEQAPVAYQLDRWLVDPQQYRVCSGDVTRAVEKKTFEVLLYLIRNRLRVVTRDELLDNVWTGRVVSYSVLARSIMKARRAIASGTTQIETVHGVGYKFVGEVAEVTPPAVPAQPNATRLPRRAWWAIAGSLAGLVVGILALYLLSQAPPVAQPVAVLPVSNQTQQSDLKWVEHGLGAVLAEAMADNAGVWVIPNKQVEALLSDSPDTAPALADNLGADRLIESALTREEGQFHLIARVVNLGTERVDHEVRVSGTDPVALVAEAGSKLAARITTTNVVSQHLVSQDAFANEAYAKGQDAMLKGHAPAAEDYFKAALRQDHSLIGAEFGLASAVRDQGRYGEATEYYERLRQLAQDKGLDRLEADVLHAMALTEWRRSDLDQARQLEEQSMNVRGTADPIATGASELFLGILASRRSEYQKAASHYANALAAYQQAGYLPGQASTYNSLGVLAWRQFDISTSEAMHERALDIRTRLGQDRQIAASLNNLGTIAAFRGQLETAVDLYQQALALRRQLSDPAGIASTLRNLADLDIRLGHLDQAKVKIDEARDIALLLNDEVRKAWVAGAAGRVAWAAGDQVLARDFFREQLSYYVALDDLANSAATKTMLASVLPKESEQAARLLDEAAASARALGQSDTVFQTQLVRARRLVESGDLGEAQSILENILDTPDRPDSRKTIADVAALLGQIYASHGLLDNAAELLPDMEGWRADYPPVLLSQACLAAASGEQERAVALHQRAVRLAGQAVPSLLAEAHPDCRLVD